MDGPSIEARDLTKQFGDVTALAGVDVEFTGPAILGIAGPNGSGKTTLMHTLLGLLAPTSGETRLGGTPSRELAPSERARVGYMPQHTAVYDDLTVRENVAFFADLYDVGDREAIDRALEFVALDDRAGARVDELSGGMVRRTSLACALVHDPDVLVLDEPTVGLDPQLRASMWEGFRERTDDGALVLVSTHYLGEARNCDQVLFLRDGRVLALDSPAAFLERTGTDDMEDAFLSLLANGAEGEASIAGGDER